MSTLVFFQAEDGIRDLVRSRGLGDVYKRQVPHEALLGGDGHRAAEDGAGGAALGDVARLGARACLLYTSDAADERSSVDLGGRRIIKKKTIYEQHLHAHVLYHVLHTLRDIEQFRGQINPRQ